MGALAATGIPTDIDGRALADARGTAIPGLYAAGELVGGLFYHNYAGGSGLMAGSVFGKTAGDSAAAHVGEGDQPGPGRAGERQAGRRDHHPDWPDDEIVGYDAIEELERWGREHGATLASTDTYIHSPLSVPFWQERMGYRPRSLVMWKRLRAE